MKYYLVNLNEDVKTYAHCIVYLSRELVYPSPNDIHANYVHSGYPYRMLVADISEEDLVIMKLRGVVEYVDDSRVSHGAVTKLNISTKLS